MKKRQFASAPILIASVILLGYPMRVAWGQSAQTFRFQEPPPPPSLSTSVSESRLLQQDMGQAGTLGNECQAMLQQLDAMKNQPLRRDALWQRYRDQCQSGIGGAPSYVPPLPQ